MPADMRPFLTSDCAFVSEVCHEKARPSPHPADPSQLRMFDGRETLMPLNNPATVDANLDFDLTDQATSAVLTHAQGAAPPTAKQLAQIVQFETGLSTAQTRDNVAGSLSYEDATGGPYNLYEQPYSPGVNDPLGGNPIGGNFNSSAFSLYTAWENIPAPTHFPWVPLTPNQSSSSFLRKLNAGCPIRTLFHCGRVGLRLRCAHQHQRSLRKRRVHQQRHRRNR